MAKANKDGWIRHRGGKCPVKNGTPIDIKFRGIPEERANMYAEHWEWLHRGASGDIMAYRIHPTEQQEPTTMTAEEIRAQYMENLSSIAMLHTKNAALVDDLRKLGFDFYTAAQEPQEDMSDPKNWRVGDSLVLEAGWFKDAIDLEGSVVTISRITQRSDGELFVAVKEFDDKFPWHSGYACNFKFHSRPTK